LIIQGRQVSLERPQKPLYSKSGVTKADLAHYLLRVSGRMLPHLRDRPLTFVRMPDGVDGTVFYQKNTPAHMPDWIPRCAITSAGGTIDYCLVNEPPALVVLADQAVGEIHGWISTCRHPDRPDRLVVDFDPPHEGRFPWVVEGARLLVDLLEKRGGSAFVMLTGSRGIHVVVPLVPQATLDEVNQFADALGRSLVRHRGDRFTMEARKARRGDKVYLDTLRNRRNQTSVMPYSPRIREQASIAAPITLGELDDEGLHPRMVTINNAEDRLRGSDPWRGFFDRAVTLSQLL
jgi:bifunctional non-homologous end joining protein LigD